MANTTEPLASSTPASSSHLIVGVRRQAAFVRALLDEIERALPSDLAGALGLQLVEELGRLGGRCLEAAGQRPVRASQP